LSQTRPVLKIFLVALPVFAAQGLLYTAHRGFDFLEIAIVAPVSATFTTFYWLRKFPTPREYSFPAYVDVSRSLC